MSRRDAGRQRMVTQLDIALEATPPPGFGRLLGGVRDTHLDLAGLRDVDRGAGRPAEDRDRAEQVVDDTRDCELGARRRERGVGGLETAQRELAEGEGGLGGAELIEGIGSSRPIVGAGVAGGGGGLQALEVVRPAVQVARRLLVGQSLVDEPHDASRPRSARG